jgi:hypothetical protein
MRDGEMHIDSNGGNDHVQSIPILYIISYCIISYYSIG